MARGGRTDRGVILRLPGATLRLDACEAGIVRIRKHPGDEPPVSPLIRDGFFRDEWPEVGVELVAPDYGQAAWWMWDESKDMAGVAPGPQPAKRPVTLTLAW